MGSNLIIVCDADKPTYGLTKADFEFYRVLIGYGLHPDTAMKHLKATYEGNLTLSKRPLNFSDNVYKGKPFDVPNSTDNT